MHKDRQLSIIPIQYISRFGIGKNSFCQPKRKKGKRQQNRSRGRNKHSFSRPAPDEKKQITGEAVCLHASYLTYDEAGTRSKGGLNVARKGKVQGAILRGLSSKSKDHY
jgi:hypothetical protein